MRRSGLRQSGELDTWLKQIRLGVIGLSPGNGHPYSWSAIFNGYDAEVMGSCGFPAIPRYLERQKFPDDAIQEACVTHVWAQDADRAHHIASAARIGTVVRQFDDMIGEIDGVLLARDDAVQHVKFAKPFLEAGLPIYIDKPLALSIRDAEQLIKLQQYPGQLFSCSALRYAPELKLDSRKRDELGRLRYVHGVAPSAWDTYAAHLIEPFLCLAEDRGAVQQLERRVTNESISLNAVFESGLQANLSTLGFAGAPIAFRVIGEAGWCDLVFSDTFRAFKTALIEFVQGALRRDVRISEASMLEVVSFIEAGRGK